MEDYNIIDNSLTNKAIILLNRNLTELQRLRLDRITDYLLCKTIDHLILEQEKITLLIKENPRFTWVTLQNELDRTFLIDKTLTGACIHLEYKKVGEGKERVVRINGKFSKTN